MSTQVEVVAKTLPARYYTNPEIFCEELERFYCQSWVCVGREEQVTKPGDYFLREIARESVITRCFGPDASAVTYGRLISVDIVEESSIFAFSAASYRRWMGA